MASKVARRISSSLSLFVATCIMILDFLKDLRRLNVVPPRAKKGVIIIGNKATLVGGAAEEESTKVWRRLSARIVSVMLPTI